MLNFFKTLTPDAIAHLAVIVIIAVLSAVLIVSDYRNRREVKSNTEGQK